MEIEAPKPITVIQPAQGWRFPNLREVWDYRGVISNFVRRNLTVTYRQTVGGPIYAIYNPFMTMIGYSFLLGGLFKARTEGDIPYPLFTFSALIVWTLFTSTLNMASTTLVRNSSLVQKIYIPRLIFPLIDAAMSLVNFAIAFVVLLVMMVGYGRLPTANILMLPVLTILAAGMGLGVGLFFAGMHAHFRDTTYMIGVVTRGLFFITPVVYTSRILPAPWDTLYRFNPMSIIVEGFRWSLLNVGEPPSVNGMLYVFVFTIGVLVIGAMYFKRLEATIVDVM